jgi:hypothetical protein
MVFVLPLPIAIADGVAAAAAGVTPITNVAAVRQQLSLEFLYCSYRYS